jgi:hypothetical protein
MDVGLGFSPLIDASFNDVLSSLIVERFSCPEA